MAEQRGAADEAQMPRKSEGGKMALAAGYSQMAWLRRAKQEPERT